METLLKEYAREIGIILTDDMIEKFIIYKNTLLEWNSKMNLTAITEEREIITKHFIDSLTIEKYIPDNARVIDVGTGAGFPGIPLKIVRNDIEVVLLDSLNKRVRFLNEIIRVCDLDNIIAVHGRAEDLGRQSDFREKFDIATARAVANLATLSEFCTPFVKIGGAFVCMKGEAEEEIKNAEKAMQELNMRLETKERLKLVGTDADRTIIVYKKSKGTPKQYPRKAGIPAKTPIQ